MIQALENPSFFTDTEKQQLQSINLSGTAPWSNREVFASLMLASVLELTTADGVTTPAEFQGVEEFLLEIERTFELTTKEKLEGTGATLGMLPFLKTQWPAANYRTARVILGETLNRLEDEDAHAVRNAIARACHHAIRATAGFMQLAGINEEERTALREVISSLKLDQCAEGLKLLGAAD